jgi:hypothetical protein
MKKVLILISFFLLANVGCTVSDPEMMELLQEIKAQNDKLLQEVEAMKGTLALLDGKYQVILASLADNKKELEALKSQIDALKTQIAQQLLKIDQLSAQLTQQGADIVKLSAEIAELKASCEELKGLIEELLADKSPIPTNGLVGWWPFNGNANDESGNGNNGSVNGAVLTGDRSGNQEKAYSFNGTTSRIVTSKIPNLTGNITISAWFNTKSLNPWGTIIDCRVSTNNGLGIEHNDKISFTTSIGTTYKFLYANHQLKTNTWVHVVAVFNGSEKLIFINGNLDNTQSSVSMLSTTEPWVFGDRGVVPSGPGNYFKGELDDIAIWNRALTDTEISKIYKGEKF